MTAQIRTSPELAHTKLCFWWSCECKAMFGVFRALKTMQHRAVRVVTEVAMNPERIRLGWASHQYDDLSPEVLPEFGWADRIENIMEEESSSLHILNSHYNYRK